MTSGTDAIQQCLVVVESVREEPCNGIRIELSGSLVLELFPASAGEMEWILMTPNGSLVLMNGAMTETAKAVKGVSGAGSCEKIGWQAEAPAPLVCEPFGTTVGQTLSSATPITSPIISQLTRKDLLMDAAPILARIAALLDRHGLEAVLIGNAAAALQGAPVTTVDLDFLFRKTPTNLKKLKALAVELEAVIFKPEYPVSGLLRVARDSDGLQLDFMTAIDGIRSFEGLRKRASAVRFGETTLYVAALADIIKSKAAAGRPRDLAVLGILETTLAETAHNAERSPRSSQEGE